MWEATCNGVAGGFEYQVSEGDSNLTCRQLFALLQSSLEFADWYSEILGSFDADALYWELPPLTTSSLDDTARFVLIDAPVLARLPSDPTPFAAYFDNSPADDVVVFPNLGGDATLVVPAPRGPREAYPHLAAFLRAADKKQVRQLWRRTAETVFRRVSDQPLWINTAGGGVFWLHVRLDSRPKYYQYRPYAALI